MPALSLDVSSVVVVVTTKPKALDHRHHNVDSVFVVVRENQWIKNSHSR